MSDKNNNDTAPANRPKERVAEKSSGKGGSAWLVALLLILLLAGGGAGFWFFQETRRDLQELHQYVGKLEQQLQSKTASVGEFQNKLTQISAEAKSQDLVLNDHLRELENALQNLGTQFNKVVDSTTANETWLLSEAEYLLKTADHRILMKEDVKGAVNILKSADNLIKKMSSQDQGLLKVRVAIAQEIASLQALSDIDVLGTYAQLTALGEQIERLPLMKENFERTTGPEGKSTTPDTLSKINDTMRGYLTIKKHDPQAIKAMLSDEDVLSLRNSLRMMIEQAQTALLLGDQRIYDSSLAKLRSRVHQYFLADNFKVDLAIKKIDELLKMQVKNDLPDISGARQALKRYLNDRARAQ